MLQRKQIKKPCNYEGCECLTHTKGYCRKHYNYVVLGVDPFKAKIKRITTRRKKLKEPCEVKGCDEFAKCKNMCVKHYQRVKRHGDPGVNYARKYQTKPLQMMRTETRYYSNMDEREVLDDMFNERIGINEGENIYSID